MLIWLIGRAGQLARASSHQCSGSRVAIGPEIVSLHCGRASLGFKGAAIMHCTLALEWAVRSFVSPILGADIYSMLTIKLSMRQVILTPGEDGYWVVEVPSLPGCISQGKTREEAITNIKEAIDGYIAALLEDGLRIPEEHFEVLVAVV